MTVYKNVCDRSSYRIDMLTVNIISTYIIIDLIGPEGSGLSQSGIVDMI